jgi:hypothetical protein
VGQPVRGEIDQPPDGWPVLRWRLA